MYMPIFKRKCKLVKKKKKKPFLTDEEWKELDEEDDECMFIEEMLEDD